MDMWQYREDIMALLLFTFLYEEWDHKLIYIKKKTVNLLIPKWKYSWARFTKMNGNNIQYQSPSDISQVGTDGYINIYINSLWNFTYLSGWKMTSFQQDVFLVPEATLEITAYGSFQWFLSKSDKHQLDGFILFWRFPSYW